MVNLIERSLKRISDISIQLKQVKGNVIAIYVGNFSLIQVLEFLEEEDFEAFDLLDVVHVNNIIVTLEKVMENGFNIPKIHYSLR